MMVSMMMVSRLIGRIDSRLLIAIGFSLCALSLWDMTLFDFNVSESHIVWNGVLLGFGLGLVFPPLTTLTFATLPPDFRADAEALQNLARNTGAAIGIAVTSFMLTRNTQTAHADLAANITPFPRLTPMSEAAHRLLDPSTPRGAGLLDAAASVQLATGPAAIIAPIGTVTPGTAISLNGSASVALTGNIVSHQWTQVSGPTVAMSMRPRNGLTCRLPSGLPLPRGGRWSLR